MIQFEIATINLDQFDSYLEAFPAVTTKATALAINSSARKGRTLAKNEIQRQVNFRSSYLDNKGEGALRISSLATESNLRASIRARFRPTSLVEFTTNSGNLMKRGASGTIVAGRGTARVKVNPGSTAVVDKAYLLRLRNGNLGFAIRPGKGGVRGSTKSYPIGRTGWHLLYGPSVNQVFNTVRADVAPDIATYLSAEFNRQFKRLSK